MQSLQLRHWRDDFDLILTDRDVSMHSIIISQKPIETTWTAIKKWYPQQRTCRSSICQAPSICQRSSVVYEAVCQQCGRTYIGMTTRRLHDRMREHMAAARRKDESTAFGAHFKHEHPKSKPKISFSILSQQRDELRLHVEEAMAIKTRQPELNRRQEELGTGFLPWGYTHATFPPFIKLEPESHLQHFIKLWPLPNLFMH